MKKLVLLACAALLILAGCAQQPITREKAYELARNGECGVFNLTDRSYYDNSTGSWRIDIQPMGDRCYRHCAVSQNGSVKFISICLDAEP